MHSAWNYRACYANFEHCRTAALTGDVLSLMESDVKNDKAHHSNMLLLTPRQNVHGKLAWRN